jgi:hypothetical protein
MDIINGIGGYLIATFVGFIIYPVSERILNKQIKFLISKLIKNLPKDKQLRNDILNFLTVLAEGMNKEDFKKVANGYKESFKIIIAGKYDDIFIDVAWNSIMKELPEIIEQLKEANNV